MKRRDFIKGVAVASLVPLTIGNAASKIGATTNSYKKGMRFLDSADFTQRIKKYFDNPRTTSGHYEMLSRIPIINADDETILKNFKGKGRYYAADVVSDDEVAVVYDSVGKHDFAISTIPNIKMGASIGDGMATRLEAITNNEATDIQKSFALDWLDTYAENMATGIHQRILALSFAVMCGGLDTKLGDIIRLETPEGVHIETDWRSEDAKPISDILRQVRFINKHAKNRINRMTISSELMRTLLENKQVRQRISKKYKMDVIPTSDGLGRLAFEKIFGLKVELYDGHYYIRGNDGKRESVRYLPTNKILLSSTKTDGNKDIFYFGNGVVTESIVSDLVGEGDVTHGAIGYFTAHNGIPRTAEDFKEVRGWAVARGLPVLEDEYAFSTITVR